MALTWRAADDSAAPAWAQLTTVVAEHDGHEEVCDTDAMLDELHAPGFDPALHAWTVWDGDTLVAAATVTARTTPRFDGLGQVGLEGLVHPDWRGQGLGTELLTRGEAVGHQLAAERTPGVDYVLRASGGNEHDPARALLVDHGYAIVRHFHEMTRRTAAGLPELGSVPDRTRIVTFTAELSEATRDAHNDAFATHWGSGPSSPERWNQMVQASAFRAADSRVVLDGGGRVLAYALAGQWLDDELYVELVGTRQSEQGRGLGRVVLGDLVHAATASGRYARVTLDVDTENRSDAGKLYRRLGFEQVRTTAAFQKQFGPGAVPR